MNKLTLTALATTALLGVCSTTQAAVLLTEDFESGLPAGWTFSGSSIVATPVAPITTSVLHINAGGATPEIAETPEFDLTGATFVTLEYDYQFSVSGNATRYVDVQFWNGASWVTLQRHARTSPITLTIDKQQTVTSGFSTDNKFRFLGKTNNDAAQFYLDNVTVTSDAIPEPGSLALMGLGGLMMLKRRRRG